MGGHRHDAPLRPMGPRRHCSSEDALKRGRQHIAWHFRVTKKSPYILYVIQPHTTPHNGSEVSEDMRHQISKTCIIMSVKVYDSQDLSTSLGVQLLRGGLTLGAMHHQRSWGPSTERPSLHLLPCVPLLACKLQMCKHLSRQFCISIYHTCMHEAQSKYLYNSRRNKDISYAELLMTHDNKFDCFVYLLLLVRWPGGMVGR